MRRLVAFVLFSPLPACFASSKPVEEGGEAGSSGSAGESGGGTATADASGTSTSAGTSASATTDPTATTSVDEAEVGSDTVSGSEGSTTAQTTGTSCAYQTIDFEADLAMGMCELNPDFAGVTIDGVLFRHDLPDVCLFAATGPFTSRFIELRAATNSMNHDPVNGVDQARIVFSDPVVDVSMWLGRKGGSTNYRVDVDNDFVGNYDVSSTELLQFTHPGPLGEIWITWNDGDDPMIGIDDLTFCPGA
jgi:hypothetical protein